MKIKNVHQAKAKGATGGGYQFFRGVPPTLCYPGEGSEDDDKLEALFSLHKLKDSDETFLHLKSQKSLFLFFFFFFTKIQKTAVKNRNKQGNKLTLFKDEAKS